MGIKVTILKEQEIEAISEAFADDSYPADDQGMAMLFPDRERMKAYISLLSLVPVHRNEKKHWPCLTANKEA